MTNDEAEEFAGTWLGTAKYYDVPKATWTSHRGHPSLPVGHGFRNPGTDWFISALIFEANEGFTLVLWDPEARNRGSDLWVVQGEYPTLEAAKAAAMVLMRMEGLL